MNTRTRLLLATALIVFPVAHAHAQTAETAPEAAEVQQEEAAPDIVVTGQFYDSGAKSAMKMDVPVLDTPFSVASYSDDFIKSLETTTIDQLYNYMTGVKKAGNTGYDITLRGFKAGGDDRNTILVDGLPGLTGRYGSPPTIGVERIEVVKGPMSVLYGQNQPGGFINMITKKPEANQATRVELRGSTYAGHGIDPLDLNGFSIAADTTGAFDDGGTVLYRLVGEYSNRDQFRDFTYDKGVYVAPSLTWNIGASTSLTAQLEYRKLEMSFDNGLVAPDRDLSRVAPITTRYQEPGDSRTEEGWSGSFHFSHEFANDWELNASYRSIDYESGQKEFSSRPLRADDRTLTRRARQLETARGYDYLDANLTMKFDTGPIKHQLLVGFNIGKDTIDEDRVKFVNPGACPGPFCFDIDIYNPVYGQVPDFDSLPATNPGRPADAQQLTHQLFTSETIGAYFSDLMSIGDHWKVSVGARAFRDKTTIEELRQDTPTQTKTASRTFLPSVGVMFQPTDKFTLYGSYSESYIPASPSANDINGLNPFDPVEGKQYEVGAKTENLLDGALTATLSLFRIDQVNSLNRFDCPIGVCYQQIGQARSEGIEFEANVSPVRNWQILLGYAYLDARITASLDPVEVGQRLANTAEHSANMWTRYDFDNGFGLGLGVSYTGDRAGFIPNSENSLPLELPAYTVVDLGLYYKQENYSLNLKVGNLLDETYYESAGFTADLQIAPGAPRYIAVSASFDF
ncbi:TonB-dependent receptor [Sphingomonas gilva]|uniref:TonB-dependent receptor n=1 Tax=Sphingomonas gilva TaxID=2305907 RepID=A0A396RP52_9SPHN|nr:TonB-dependent receptor [Sphingomonas gilva]RHW18218.1 TonB-dependent receptor [Sphingomonas gilva]